VLRYDRLRAQSSSPEGRLLAPSRTASANPRSSRNAPGPNRVSFAKIREPLEVPVTGDGDGAGGFAPEGNGRPGDGNGHRPAPPHPESPPQA
jgi:hypothetical protein